jgi:hypothetical protein
MEFPVKFPVNRSNDKFKGGPKTNRLQKLRESQVERPRRESFAKVLIVLE